MPLRSSCRRSNISTLFTPLILATAWCLPAAKAHADDAALRVAAPLPYQIFQRRTAAQGAIQVEGEAPADATVVRARVNEQAWQPLPLDRASRTFLGSLPTKPGGWYRVEIQALRGDTPLASQQVEPVGIGEIYVIAGQSNSTNYGQVKLKPQTGRVATFDGVQWRPADDPQPGAYDRSQNGSCWPVFGDLLVQKFDVPIGIAATGAGGTSVNQWLPRGARFVVKPTGRGNFEPAGDEYVSLGAIYNHFCQRLRALGPHGCRAVLWHQGESDSNQPDPTPRRLTGEEYQAALLQIIEKSRQEAGWPTPWFTAQATYNRAPRGQSPTSDILRAAQQQLWDRGVTLPGPDTDLLVGKLRRGVHFNEAGQRACGEAWAAQVIPWLEEQLADRP